MRIELQSYPVLDSQRSVPKCDDRCEILTLAATTLSLCRGPHEADTAWIHLYIVSMCAYRVPLSGTGRHTWAHSKCIQGVCPLRADLRVVSLHHDMAQRDKHLHP